MRRYAKENHNTIFKKRVVNCARIDENSIAFLRLGVVVNFLRVQSLTPVLSPKGREYDRDSLPSLAREGHGMGDGVLRGESLFSRMNRRIRDNLQGYLCSNGSLGKFHPPFDRLRVSGISRIYLFRARREEPFALSASKGGRRLGQPIEKSL